MTEFSGLSEGRRDLEPVVSIELTESTEDLRLLLYKLTDPAEDSPVTRPAPTLSGISYGTFHNGPSIFFVSFISGVRANIDEFVCGLEGTPELFMEMASLTGCVRGWGPNSGGKIIGRLDFDMFADCVEKGIR